jgi:hypothetical protein
LVAIQSSNLQIQQDIPNILHEVAQGESSPSEPEHEGSEMGEENPKVEGEEMDGG